MNSVSTIPKYYEKFQQNIKLLTEQLILQQKTTDAMIKQLKYIEKTAKRIIDKEEKKEKSKLIQQPAKKKGFTQPAKISSLLAKFMNVPTETMISRPDVTKFLMQYIKEKGLENPDNRRQIWPDDALWEILGEEARKENILTHFNLQKFMSKHIFH
uniref:DM2 domain-containing protein n=1 Tax=viral metagenome TaxID=1070528 RepID=A0A6C0I141_9ZZZZ